MMILQQPAKPSYGSQAFTLAEVVMSLAIVAVVMGAFLVSFTQTNQRAEWSAYSLAAQSLSFQQIERTRAAVWTLQRDDMTNMNLKGWTQNSSSNWTGYYTNTLDLLVSGSNSVVATNFVELKTLSVDSDVQIRMLRVDTVWPFAGQYAGAWTVRYFTNTSVAYYGPDDQ